jgi:hypothetical protein
MKEEVSKRKIEPLPGDMNERTRRLSAAAEAMAFGRGGISAVARTTGISHPTIRQGMKELRAKSDLDVGRIRRAGGGRKAVVDQDKNLIPDLEQLMEPVTQGILESPIRWTCKSIRQLAAELEQLGHKVSYQVVSELLHDLDYSLNPYRKTRECGYFAPRDILFTGFNRQATSSISIGLPVLSIEIKKKDVLADDSNSLQMRRSQSVTEQMYDKDFFCPGQSWVTLYTTFDPAHKSDWKNVGINQDTIAFAVASLRHWWNEVGRSKYSRSRMLLIVTNCDDIVGLQGQWWKWEMQRMVDDINIAIKFCLLPSGTIKWNTIEHHIFAWMNQKVQDKSLTEYCMILRKFAATIPEDEPVVHCRLDTHTYPPCGHISAQKVSTIQLIPEIFEEEYKYLILPHDR